MAPLNELSNFTEILGFIYTDLHLKFFHNFYLDLSAQNFKYDIVNFTFSHHFRIFNAERLGRGRSKL